MDGAGIGSVLGGLFRSVAPSLARMGNQAVQSLGKHAMTMAKDVISGEDIKTSALRNLRASGAELVDEFSAEDHIPTKRKARAKKGENRK